MGFCVFIAVVKVVFDPTSYTVSEGRAVLVTVVLSIPSTRPVSVDVSSSSGTATGRL